MPRDANIIDIAEYAGVSVSTVSRVLNNHPDVSPATRKKVMAVIEEHHYIPNDSARNLKRESMRAIAVVVKGLSNPFFTSMFQVIQEELEKNRYTMLLHQVDTRENEVSAAIALCKEKKPRGLIFMGGSFRHTRSHLAKIDVPYAMLTITLHSKVDRDSFTSVTVDDFQAGYDLTRHICAAGHRKIAFIGSNSDDISISRLRMEGYLQALRDLGLPEEDSCIEYAGEFSYQAGYEAAKRLLAQCEFTCLFCISDLLALGAMRALYEAGRRIPEDISVVGFDGLEEGRYAIPSLTTMKQPGEEMAHKCVDLLLNRLRYNAPHQHLLFDAEFLPGESFSPPTM